MLADDILEGMLKIQTSTKIPDMEIVIECHNNKILQRPGKIRYNCDEQILILNEDKNMNEQRINIAKNTLDTDTSLKKLNRHGHVTIEMVNYFIHMVRENDDLDSFGMLPAQSLRKDTDNYYSETDRKDLEDELQFAFSWKKNRTPALDSNLLRQCDQYCLHF